MLTDNFGRQFQYLRLSITDACNFKCNYCLPNGYQCDTSREFLSQTEIATLVKAFAQLGTKKVRITGGEPCLRKDVTDIIRLCKNTHGIEKVAITTNGFNLLNKIDEFVEAGLDALNVSIDSLDPKMFNAITGSNKLHEILAAVERAHQLGVSDIKINSVLLKQFNAENFDDYLAWLKDKPITVRFIELMETGDNKQFFANNHINGQTIKAHLLANGWIQVIRDRLGGPAEEYYHPDYQGKLGLIMPYSKDFCSHCNRLRVSALGKLHLCLFAEQGIDLRASLAKRDVEETITCLQNAMQNKTVSHELQQHFTGATTHLAMLGG